MNLILSIILFLLALVLILYEVNRGVKLNYSQVFNISFLIFYVTIPAIIVYNPTVLMHVDIPIKGEVYYDNEEYSLLTILYSLIFVLLYIPLYIAFKNKVNIFKYDFKYHNRIANCKISFILLTLSIFSISLYSYSYGGIEKIIMYAQIIRSGYILPDSGLVFFKQFMKASWLSFFIYYVYKDDFHIKNKNIHRIWLYTSVIVSIVSLLAYASRNWMLFFILTPLIYNYLQTPKSNFHIGKIAFVLITIGIISLYSRNLFLIMAGVENVSMEFNIFYEIVDDLSGPFTSTMNSFSYVKSEVGLLGGGLLSAFKEIIPNAVYDFGISKTVNRINTEHSGFITDYRMYTINAGILAYFVYEFNIIGIIIAPVIVAFILSQLDILFHITKNNKVLFIFNIFFALKMFQIVRNGDPASYFKHEFIMLLAFIIIYIINNNNIRFLPKKKS